MGSGSARAPVSAQTPSANAIVPERMTFSQRGLFVDNESKPGRAMPRRFLRQVLPSPRAVREAKSLRRLGRWLHNPDLWHLNRHSVARAVAVGVGVAFVPLPGQMAIVAALAVVLGCNLPVALIVVWVSNPFTAAPLYFAAYKVGAWLLDAPVRPIEFSVSLEWLLGRLGDIWQPLALGCLLLGSLAAGLGYWLVLALWRAHVLQSWRSRARRRAARSRAEQRERERTQSPGGCLGGAGAGAAGRPSLARTGGDPALDGRVHEPVPRTSSDAATGSSPPSTRRSTRSMRLASAGSWVATTRLVPNSWLSSSMSA